MPGRRQPPTMSRISPLIRLSVAFGLFCLAAIGASQARADGFLPSFGAAPLSTLVKFDDRRYEVTAADWVSLDPITSSTVRKVGYGRVTEVNIATTSTGTYSSDGMVSPHVLYPGIEVNEQLPTWFAFPLGVIRDYDGMGSAGVSMLHVSRRPSGGYSYMQIRPAGIRSCITGGSFIACNVNR